MRCPICNAWAEVLETRRKSGNVKYRRYECGNLHRFTTLEKVHTIIPPKDKKDLLTSHPQR